MEDNVGISLISWLTSERILFWLGVVALTCAVMSLVHIVLGGVGRPRELKSQKVMVEDPRIVLLEGFATPLECKELIDLALPRLEPSFVVEGKGALATDETRTSLTAHLGAGDFDAVKRIGKRACDFLGVPLSHLEPVQVVSYEPGQLYKPHFDYFMPERLEFEKGQRTDTIFVYLCEDFEGGATNFPQLGRAFKGKTGEALWWRNAPEGVGSEDQRLLHGGMPPTKGRKWGCNIWVRDRPFSSPEGV